MSMPKCKYCHKGIMKNIKRDADGFPYHKKCADKGNKRLLKAIFGNKRKKK